jgi:Leucine-rich repeat (LRR) protein
MNSNQRIAELEVENAQLRIENAALLEQLERKKRPKKLVDISKEELENRWWSLSDEWKKAFQHAFLRHGETIFLPTEKDLRALFGTEKLEIVGNGILLFGLEQLSFKLTDLSGLEHFTKLKELNLAGNNLKNLNGISHLKQLELLNLTANKITTLRGIRHLKHLKYLFLRDNNLKNLSEIQHLKKLLVFDCMNNNRLDSIGRLIETETLEKLYIFDFKREIEKEIKILITKLKDLKVNRR